MLANNDEYIFEFILNERKETHTKTDIKKLTST